MAMPYSPSAAAARETVAAATTVESAVKRPLAAVLVERPKPSIVAAEERPLAAVAAVGKGTGGLNRAPRAVIGQGTYGTIYSPALKNTNFNGEILNKWVTKIYNRKSNYDKAVANIPVIQSLGFNYNVHPYKRQLHRSKKPVFGLRMPHKGYSIEDIIKERTFPMLWDIPIPVILEQIRTLITQVSTLSDRGYIHGDIRCPNILIDTATGTFSIIDFDWFYPKSKFLEEYDSHFGFYNNPPEMLHATPLDTGTYIEQFNHNFTDLGQFDAFDEIQSDNILFLSSLKESDIMLKTLDTFDSFGLAWSLLRLFYHLYPGSLNNDTTTLQTNLRRLIPISLDEHAVAINNMVQRVLLPLGDFRLRSRATATAIAALLAPMPGGARKTSRRNIARRRSTRRKLHVGP